MTRDLRSRRLVLADDELAVVRGGRALPSGWDVGAAGPAAVAALRTRGLAGEDGLPHPALVADLERLARAELTVLVEGRSPAGDVAAAVGVLGSLVTVLRRTGPAAVELSVAWAGALPAELARLVPPAPGRPAAVVVPLADLLDPGSGGVAAALRAREGGALRATVVGRDGAGCVDWVWLGDAQSGGWAAVEPGAPGLVRLVPVGPEDLGAAVAPLAGLLLTAS